MLFLDCNAHLPVCQEALDHFCRLNNQMAGHGHPSAPSAPGRAAATALEEARNKIAQLIGAKRASQVYWVSTCTSGCAWACKIIQKQGLKVQMSPFEHTAVRDPVQKYLEFDLMPTNSSGYLLIQDQNTVCVHAQNEFGNIYPVEGVLFSDMSQSLGKIPVDVTAMDVKIATFAGHKFGGFNIGWMYLKDETWWTPEGTGSRYFMDRPGTMSVGEISATAVALEQALISIPERTARCLEFKKELEIGLQELGYTIVGGKERLPNTTFVHKKGAIEDLLKLEEAKIYVGLGSACGSMASGLSGSVRALGYTGTNQDFLRFSNWSYGATEAKQIINILKCK